MADVLIVGDSISVGYTPAVACALEGDATVARNPANGGDSSNVLAHIDEWLVDARPKIVSLNCGLHDLRCLRPDGRYQVPIESYRANLSAVIKRVSAAGARGVWVTTTPVIEGRHNAPNRDFSRHNADVDAYNAAALELAGAAGWPVIDLHAAAVGLGLEQVLMPDGVHFTPGAYEQLGHVVADGLRKELA